MALSTVMSLEELDDSTLAKIADACQVPTNQIEDVYACTSLQHEMIAGSRAEVFHIVLTFGPEGDIDRFCEALRTVVSLNPILRTRFVDCNAGILNVITNEPHVTVRKSGGVEELEKYLADDKAHRLRLGSQAFRSTTFDKKYFVATVDHTVMDYWSLTTFLSQDVVGVYHGESPKAHTPFKEFVAHINAIDESTAKTFWANRFKGIPAIFPKVPQGFHPYATKKQTKKINIKRIGNGISSAHVPSFTEAAWALVSGIYADSEIVAFGTVLSGRFSSKLSVVGPMIAEIPVLVNLQRTMTLEKLIKERATAMRQLQTSPALQYGIRKIREVSEAARIASGFRTLLNIRFALDIPLETAITTDVGFDRLVWPSGPFTLDHICSLLDDGIFVETRFDPAILHERQVQRLLNQFEHTLQLITEVPLSTKLDKLELLNPLDRMEILEWNKTIPKPVKKCVHELFHAQALKQPAAAAVEASDGRLSYSELDQMSECLARELRRQGVTAEEPVAFIFENSLYTIVAILGIMKAGGACVPIDKNDSDERKIAIISSTSARIILTSSAEYDNTVRLDLEFGVDVFVVSAKTIFELPKIPSIGMKMGSPENLAYIMFTGGANGPLKGVQLEHRSLVLSLTSLAHRLNWQPGTRMLQFATQASSISLGEIFGALLFGGCLCIPSDDARESNLSGFIEDTKANWALLPPRVIGRLAPKDVPSLESLLSIGEPVDADSSKTWGKALRFFNAWGACEASILSTVAEPKPESSYPESIGTPVGCAVWIVNVQNTNELVPIGGIGELVIEGSSVARGYLNVDAKTAASFIAPPQWASLCERTASRFYRTGDLAKYNPDGSISFIGKQENRIKLGGRKVQLEEVERTIAGCPEVRDVVISSKISAGRTQLYAVVCLADPQLPQKAVLQPLLNGYTDLVDERLNAVRNYAQSMLPADRVPTIWMTVEQLPRTTSERLDRGAIREWLKNRS